MWIPSERIRKIGIKIIIDVIPGSALKQAKANGKLNFFRASWIADYPDAENYLSLFYSKNFAPNGPNYTHFFDQNYDKLYEQSLKENDQTNKEFLYKKESPNAYLAKFAQFLIDNKKNDYMRTLIDNGLDRFIRHQILQFKEAKKIPIHFVGSISYFLKDEINAKLESYGLKLGNVVKRPIDNLVQFHSEHKTF